MNNFVFRAGLNSVKINKAWSHLSNEDPCRSLLWDGDLLRAAIDACPNVRALNSLTLVLVAQHVLGFLYNTKQRDEQESLGTGCVFGCSTTAVPEDGGGSRISQRGGRGAAGLFLFALGCLSP